MTSGTGAPVRGGPKATSQRLGPAPDLISRGRRGQVGAAGSPSWLTKLACSQGAKERLSSRAACGHSRVGGGRTSGPGAAGAAGAARDQLRENLAQLGDMADKTSEVRGERMLSHRGAELSHYRCDFKTMVLLSQALV